MSASPYGFQVACGSWLGFLFYRFEKCGIRVRMASAWSNTRVRLDSPSHRRNESQIQCIRATCPTLLASSCRICAGVLVWCPISILTNSAHRNRHRWQPHDQRTSFGKPAKSAPGKARTAARLNIWRGFVTQHGADSRQVFGKLFMGQHTRASPNKVQAQKSVRLWRLLRGQN